MVPSQRLIYSAKPYDQSLPPKDKFEASRAQKLSIIVDGARTISIVFEMRRSTMKNSRITLRLFIAALTICILCQCDDDGEKGQPSPPPEVDSITPSWGPMTTVVTVIGKNFGPSPENIEVRLNGKVAEIVSSTETSIVFTVPKSAGNGLIEVVVNGMSAEHKPKFQYTWMVSTWAGKGDDEIVDGLRESAAFSNPTCIAIDRLNNLYVGDYHAVRKISPEGMVTTLAGSSEKGYVDGFGMQARFNNVTGLAVDSLGNIYVADSDNNRIRKITPDGVVSTIAGSDPGLENGIGSDAKFHEPLSLALDKKGNLFVADSYNHLIRRVSLANNEVTTFAGSTNGFADGPAPSAKFSVPFGVCIDKAGNLYVADLYNYRIRKITPDGTVSTHAGGDQGVTDGQGTNAKFHTPISIGIDSKENIFVMDLATDKLRIVSPTRYVSTFAGGDEGYLDGQAMSARFASPHGVTVADDGSIYVADKDNLRIRVIR